MCTEDLKNVSIFNNGIKTMQTRVQFAQLYSKINGFITFITYLESIFMSEI